MTRIDVTPIEDMHAHLVRENVELREENAKIREVNAEQAKHIGDLREQLRQAQQRITTLGLAAKPFWPKTARSGE